jgi:hypothetical protein
MECTCASGTCQCGTVVGKAVSSCGCMDETAALPAGAVAQYFDTYGPLITVLLAVDVGAVELGGTLQTELSLFLGLFMLVFGGLQLKNVREYVPSLGRYNGLARRYPAYGYALPFLEVMLGALFTYAGLARPSNLKLVGWVNWSQYLRLPTVLNGSLILTLSCLAVIFVFSVDAWGVVASLRKGRRPTCACLGLILAVPLSPLTVFEDVAMVVAAVTLLVLGRL